MDVNLKNSIKEYKIYKCIKNLKKKVSDDLSDEKLQELTEVLESPGPQGPQGPPGPPGPPGQVYSTFFWSEQGQYGSICNNTFNPIIFEKGPIGNNIWELSNYKTPLFHSGVTLVGPTQFKCLCPGFYTITYKVDIYIKNSCQGKNYTDIILVLTLNGNQINGSQILNSLPKKGNIFSLTTTVLVKINKNDIIGLLFYSDSSKNGNCHIGYPSFISNLKLPNGSSVNETTASILFTKLLN